MLASPTHKFVMLLNPKTATTSINKALAKYAHVKVGGNGAFKHLNYAQYRDMFGDYFDRNDCHVFVVIRKPIDTLHSWYRFRSNPHRYKNVNPVRSTENVSFQEFLDSWNSADPLPYAKVPCGVDFCKNSQGELPQEVNYYRYEDLGKLADRLSQLVGNEITLPALNISKSLDDSVYQYDQTATYPRLEMSTKLYNSIPFR